MLDMRDLPFPYTGAVCKETLLRHFLPSEMFSGEMRGQDCLEDLGKVGVSMLLLAPFDTEKLPVYCVFLSFPDSIVKKHLKEASQDLGYR